MEGDTERRLLDMEGLLTFGELHNPVDIRGYGADHLPEIADALFGDDAYDAYVFAVGLSAVDERAEDIADDLLAVADAADDPVLFLWTGRKDPDELDDPQPYERVREEVPLFYDPGRCMDALASLVEFGSNRDRLADRPSRNYRRSESDRRDVEVPSGRTLTWRESADLLSAFDIETVETRLVEGPEEAATVASDLGFPVVLKVDSADVPHRSTVGGVRTDVRSAADARDAYEEILSSVREAVPDAEIEGVLVQSQVEDGVEALAGVSTDPEFGPLVAVGPGGTLVEQFDERALLVPPFTAAEATEAIAETRLDALLAQSDGDASALAELLARVGDFAAECESLDELDLNPVLVRESGVAVVDALVRTR
ncbi:acetate--CoA ligase family protein [Halorussus sp. MSC15.2]|uniref:acetate--CoA ligase family protein n=1 Tax=Halorussus sp. MSC15.2 TaxID=2283638 RepID=UPI001F07DD2B|nr:acetate--CoA ligase family protein [Halorussus sp. MSC15.2]